MTVLRIEDGISIGLCAKGQAKFCREHGLDLRRFVKEGLPFEEIERIDDRNIKLAMEVAVKREAEDGRR